MSALLEVSHLAVSFPTDAGAVRAVDDVSFHVDAGEVLAVVGESGSGKSVTAMALMRLHPRSAQITGSIRFDGLDLLALPPEQMRHLRGSRMAMIFQDPMTSLNPMFTVGAQIIEAIRTHQNVTRTAAARRAVELLELVGVPEPRRRVEQYPHEFSGGMRQRAMIAIAIANEPALLIADEPTTALDVTVQAQVMELLAEVRHETGAAMILITHDLGIVAGTADRIVVMYAGCVFETGDLDDIFYRSHNPYTQALLESIPQLDGPPQRRLLAIPGNPPSPLHRPPGCPFRPRCRHAAELCAKDPSLVAVTDEHTSRCHYAQEIGA